MKEYELMIIMQESITEEVFKEHQAKWETILFQPSHLIQKLDLGIRTLATPIEKHIKGRYLVYLFASTPDLISEFERVVRYNKIVLRYLVQKKADQVNVEERKVEIIEQAKALQAAKDEHERSEELSADAISERRKSAMEYDQKS